MSIFRCSTKIIKFIITTPVLRVFQIYFFISLTLSNIFCAKNNYYHTYYVDIDEYPYQISVQVDNEHFCGGAIISRRYILTTAYCADRFYHHHYSIRAGSTYHDDIGIVIGVEEVYIHPKYNARTVDFDAAILYLVKPLNYSDEIRKIKLPSYHYKYTVGIKADVTGWGLVIPGTVDVVYSLLHLVAPIMDTQTCNEVFKFPITKRMFCVRYPTDDFPRMNGGERGAPMVVDGILMGMMSHRIPYFWPHADRETVCIKVALIRKFIRDITEF